MLCAAVALTIGALGTARAQVTSVDEGSFTIFRNGERLGREDFWIRSTPSSGGLVYVAQGTLVFGTRRLRPGLSADTSGAVLKFQREVRVDGRLTESYAGQSTRNHYAGRTQRENGESAREFRLPPGTVAADDDVMHELWFITRRGAGAVVPVLVPSRDTLETVRVELVGDEPLARDGRDVSARHLRLRTVPGGAIRDVWTDAAGRVIQVEIPARGVRAVRNDVR